jgi:hypothetical protein
MTEPAAPPADEREPFTAEEWSQMLDEDVAFLAEGKDPYPGATEEAARRGLDIPTGHTAEIDNLPPEALSDQSFILPDHDTDDVPINEIHYLNLERMAVDGDTRAAAELHERYPNLYTPEGTRKPEKPLSPLVQQLRQELGLNGDGTRPAASNP